MRGKVNRDDIEHQFRIGRIEAIAASREVRERRAGIDALIPSGERVGERALDYRRAHHGDIEVVALREDQLLAEALGVAVSVGPSPTKGARLADFLEALFDPPFAAAIGDRLMLAILRIVVGRGREVIIAGQLGLTKLIARFRFDARNGGERLANLSLQIEVALADRAPVLRDVVFVAMAIGNARRIAGRDVHHRGIMLLAVFDDVGDAERVDGNRFLQRGLEIHHPGAMHDRIERAALDRIDAVADETLDGDVAGDDDDFFFDEFVEAGAELLPQRTHHRRVEHLAPKAIEAGFPVASDQQINALDFRMPSEQQVEKNLAEKSGRAGQQDGALAEHLFERRHRRSGMRFAVKFFVSVAIRHRQLPVAEGASR